MQKILALIALVILGLGTITGCGGGGGGNGNNTVAYSTNPAVYTKDVAITANTPTVTGGAATSFAVSPALPAGLSLDTTTGVITGKPTSVSAATIYTVTATNTEGSVNATLLITVNAGSGGFPGDVMAAWEGGPSYYSSWSKGPSTTSSFFPIAAFLQSPSNAAAFKSIGINYYVGLYQGPTETELSQLTTAALPVMADQNSVGLNSVNNGIIKAWMQQDEPDNAQNGTEDPVPTAEILSRYHAMVATDGSRPVYLNLGQGVASDLWYGRGHRTNHPEDYSQYALGGDILSFDIYPMNVYPASSGADWYQAFHNAVAQNIWYVALGVDRLRQSSSFQKPVWVWIESTNISSNANYALTPTHVKAEVWMAIIHGARGIGYFTHRFTSGGGYITDCGLLNDPEMKTAVTAINAQITALAPVLNTQSVANGVTVASSNTAIPVDTMVKRLDGYSYVFAVAMRPGNTTGTFTLRGFTGSGTVEVVGEGRNLSITAGVFHDNFSSHGVHIYRIANP